MCEIICVSMSPNSRDLLRRGVGLLFLATAVGMVIAGLTAWGKSLTGRAFVEYWLLCWAFVTVAMIFALWDVRITRLRIREEKLELLHDTVKEVENQIKKTESERDGG